MARAEAEGDTTRYGTPATEPGRAGERHRVCDACFTALLSRAIAGTRDAQVEVAAPAAVSAAASALLGVAAVGAEQGNLEGGANTSTASKEASL